MISWQSSRTQRLVKIISRQTFCTARHTEHRVLEIILEIAEKYKWDWFLAARIATPEEDRHGIDVVVETNDIGKLLFQVKSSKTGAKKFLEKRHGPHIAIIIVGRHASQQSLSNEITGAVLKERKAILALRKPAIALD